MAGAGWPSALPGSGGVSICTPGCPLHREGGRGGVHGGRGGWGGIAAAIAGAAPATPPHELRHLTRDKLNQTLPERIKSGNPGGKLHGNRDMDPNPSWLLPRDRQGHGLCQGLTRGLAPLAPAVLACTRTRGEAGVEPQKPRGGWKHPSPGELALRQAALLIYSCKRESCRSFPPRNRVVMLSRERWHESPLEHPPLPLC